MLHLGLLSPLTIGIFGMKGHMRGSYGENCYNIDNFSSPETNNCCVFVTLE